jgi:hypothetical protein
VSACSGTLLAPRIVVTAAHCVLGTDGTRVKQIGSKTGRSDVDLVFNYDYDTTDKASLHEAHDLALLVLASPLAANYPKWAAEDPNGQEVVLYGRSGGSFVKASGKLSSRAPVGRPTARMLAQGIDDAGGAVLRADGAIVGVVMGKGQTSGAGYVALASKEKSAVFDWIDAAVNVLGAAPEKASTASTKSTGLHLRNSGGGGGGGGGEGSSGGGEGNQNPSEDVGNESGNENSGQEQGEQAPEKSTEAPGMITRPDGTTTQRFDDGSSLTTHPDGSTTSTPSNWALNKSFNDSSGNRYQFNPNLGGGIDSFDSGGNYTGTQTMDQLYQSNPGLARQMGYYYMQNIGGAMRQQGYPVTPRE